MKKRKLKIALVNNTLETHIINAHNKPLLCPYASGYCLCTIQCAMFEEFEDVQMLDEAGYYCNYRRQSVFLGLNAEKEESATKL